MRENFLHYVWQYKKFDVLLIETTQHEPLEIISVGLLNLNSGPDFFNGRLRIGEQLWAGNIEIHVKSSDWFLHNHQKDPAYDNVILHVVYEHDIDVYRRDNSITPTLELKNYIHEALLSKYYNLFSKQKSWINCEQNFTDVPKFEMDNWLERLYFERLERKSEVIFGLLKTSNYDWEAVLFKLLAKNFGLKVNGDTFFSLANSMEFSVVRKLQSHLHMLEALLFGQSGLLDKTIKDSYYIQLQKDYQFLKQKFQLDSSGVFPLKFFRLRPSSFPTLRLSQLASLYHNNQHLFSKIVNAKESSQIYSLFNVSSSTFWNTHYTFTSSSTPSIKKLSRSFIDLIIINAIIPLKFSYEKYHGSVNVNAILDFIRLIDSEKNKIIDGFNRMNYDSKSAMNSQALIQLKTEYCDQHQCLKCAIGNSLLNK
ncbi:DUF2851 family protein [Psychroserpens sp. MEBiC05023]